MPPASGKAADGKTAAAAAPATQSGAAAAYAAPEVKAEAGASAPAAEARDASMWQAVKVGGVVLVADHSEGEFQGWWPAKVLTRAGDSVTCEWLGFTDMGRQVRSLSGVALLHPLHKG